MNLQRFGLQARYGMGMAIVLALGVALLAVLVLRQAQMQSEVGALGAAAVHDAATEGLQRRGEASTQRLAESLANPLYYSDLDAIRAMLESVLRQPDVSYALVFDAQGQILHDGTRDIGDYGQPMRDPLAARAIATHRLLVQWSEESMDVSQAIYVGDQHLGGVRVGYSLDDVRLGEKRAATALQQRLAELAREYLGWFIALLAALAAVCIGGIWYVQRMLVTPVRQLASAARAIGAGRYDAQLPVSRRSDEIGELMQAFARMGDSIASHDREVRRMAYTDALTGMVNRLAFREALERSLAALRGTGQPLALLFIDLDGFKDVNDALGHDAGDAVLVEVAGRIRQALAHHGGEGSLAARFGGDEFVILLQQGDVHAAAERLCAWLLADIHYPVGGTAGRKAPMLGASIGIALFPDDATDAAELLNSSDVAMYEAKLAGKNCWRFYERSMAKA
jgi:diguanylate cyclase (GGDEF)-like protein